jgi:hypothetical protein
MIRLKKLLLELSDKDLKRLLKKIQDNQFKFVGQGDNGRVYEIDGEDKVFKITRDDQEFEVAQKIEGELTIYTTFIPVYYTGKHDSHNMIIMSKADPVTSSQKQMIDQFVEQFKQYSYTEGGEVSIFDFLDSEQQINIHPLLENFLRALQTDVRKTNIEELDLDLDFKSDNVMDWNGKMVMVDW